MVKIIHVSDTHLGFRLKYHYKKDWFNEGKIRWYENDFYERWDDFINFCIDNKNNIDFIVHSGDIFHNPFGDNVYPPPEPAREVLVKSLKIFFEKTENKIPFILIDGNHGIYLGYRYSVMDSVITSFPNLHYYSIWDLKYAISNNHPLICEFKEKNIRFYLFPYFNYKLTKDVEIAYGNWIENQRTKEDMIEVAIVHASDIDNTFHEKINSFNYSYIALGHEHNQRKVSKNAYYPGSFVPLGFDEINITHGFLEVTIERNKDSIIKPHIFKPTRDFKDNEFEITPSVTTQSVLTFLKDSIKEYKIDKWDGKSAARLRFIFKGTIPLEKFWGLNEELDFFRSSIINKGDYNLLQIVFNFREVIKHLGDEFTPETIKEYILENPKSEFLKYIHGKVKSAEGYDMQMLADIAIMAIETALKKFGGED